jgi:hypothetical protein
MAKAQKIGKAQILKHMAAGDVDAAFRAFERMAGRCTDDQCVEVMQQVGPLF